MSLPIYHSQYTAQQIEDSIGKSPRVNDTTKEWEVWDIATSAYVGTGVIAESAAYAEDAQAAATAAENAQAAAEAAAGVATGSSENIVLQFSQYVGYPEGTLVYYNEMIYRFLEYHGGPWTGEDAEPVVLAEALSWTDPANDGNLVCGGTD